MGLFDFKVKDGVLVRYAGKAEEVTVPDKVRVIGEAAFKGNERIRSVTIPEGVREIKKEAFFLAKNLEKIRFPSSLEVIGPSAFQACSSLREIRLPKALRTIGRDGFSHCRSLKEAEIPSGVKKVDAGAFYQCTSLVRCRFLDTTEIGALAFAGCGALEEYDMPEKYFTDRRWFTGVFGVNVPTPVREEKAGEGGAGDKDAASLMLQHRTRADLPLADKQYIFLHSAPADRARAQQLSDKILAFENGAGYAVWTAGSPRAVFRAENRAELSRMAVFIPVITENYLKMAQAEGTDASGRCLFSLEDFNREVAAVLPVFLLPGCEEKFNRLFGDLHGIDLSNFRLQMQLEAHLESLLGASDLSSSIRDRAFSRDLFLSYRKKDREQALSVMRRIHDTPEGKGAAIWFDDFLVPGEDFREQISDMLRQADAMILSVTPHVLEEGNYVKEIEYPDAKRKMNKTVIPVEASSTDPDLLKKDFPDIGTPVPADDAEALNEQLMKISGRKTGKTYGPLELYLLGMAFLTGFRVEKDTARGVGLLEAAASGDEEHACRHLGFLYLSGRGVDRDLPKTIRWYEKAYTIYKEKQNVEEIYDLLYGMDGLILLHKAEGNITRALEMGREFLSLLAAHPVPEDGPDAAKRKLWEARALVEGSDHHFDTEVSGARLSQVEADSKKALKILSGLYGEDADEAASLKGQAEYNLGGLYIKRQDEARAMAHFKNAEAYLKEVTENNPSKEYRKIYGGILGTLGLLQRQEAIRKSLKDPFHSIDLMRPAQATLGKAVVIERRLAKEAPTINNREGLAIALFNYSLVDVDKKDAEAHLTEALSIVTALVKETGDGSFDEFEREIRTLMKKKHIKAR